MLWSFLKLVGEPGPCSIDPTYGPWGAYAAFSGILSCISRGMMNGIFFLKFVVNCHVSVSVCVAGDRPKSTDSDGNIIFLGCLLTDWDGIVSSRALPTICLAL